MVYGKDFDSAKDRQEQSEKGGGRFASVEQNKKNKKNTAKLQGESTYQTLNSDGSTSTYNTDSNNKTNDIVKQQVQQKKQQQRKTIPVQNYDRIKNDAVESGYVDKNEINYDRNNNQNIENNQETEINQQDISEPTNKNQTSWTVTTTNILGTNKIKKFYSEKEANQYIKKQEDKNKKYSVTTSKDRILINQKTRNFKTKEHADEFIKRTDVKQQPDNTVPNNKSQNNFTNFLEINKQGVTKPTQQEPIPKKELTNFTSDKNPVVEKDLSFIDKSARSYDKMVKESKLNSKNVVVGTIINPILGLGQEVIAGVTGLINLSSTVKDVIDEKIHGKILTPRKEVYTPKTISDEFIGGTIEDGFNQKGTGIKKSVELMKEQESGLSQGQAGGFVISLIATGGIGLVKRGLGIGSKIVSMPVRTISSTGQITSQSVPVAKTFNILNKSILTKTYTNPTLVKTKQVTKNNIKKTVLTTEPISKKGSYNLGKPKGKKVLDKSEIQPYNRGFEVMTGSKQQTEFNVNLVKELVKQKKIKQSDLDDIQLVSRGIELSKKTKSKVYSDFGKTPLKNINEEQTKSVMKSINKLQSPKNWFRGNKRIGQIGGSLSQNPQLKSKYQKIDIHDIDIDVPSEAIAKRGAKTVYDDISKLDPKDTKFQLSSGRGTKVEVTTKDKKSDEFIEFLSPKDTLQGNKEAIQTGLRFGEKYKSDKLSRILKKSIKEKNTNITLRDIKDQTLAKGASVLSIQGKYTEKFKGVPKELEKKWVDKQNKLTDDGILHVSPPSLRGKDTVDLYNIFKSQSEKLTVSGKIKEGKELDKIAEKYKKSHNELDFNAQRKGKSSDILESYSSPSTTSLISNKVKQTDPLLKTGSTQITNKPTQQPKQDNLSFQYKPASKQLISRPVSKNIISKKQTTKSAYKSIIGIVSTNTSKKIIKIKNNSFDSILSQNNNSKGSKKNNSKKNHYTLSPSSMFESKGSSTSDLISTTSKRSSKSKTSKKPNDPFSTTSKITKSSTGSFSTMIIKTKQPIEIIKLPPRKPIGTIVFNSDEERSKRRKDNNKKRYNFLGNTRQDSIWGLFDRDEIVYGKIEKILSGDRKTVRRINSNNKKKNNQKQNRNNKKSNNENSKYF